MYLAGNESIADHGDEDGEVSTEDDKLRYDIEKLVEWPGFNVHPSEEFMDETDYYRCTFCSRNLTFLPFLSVF